MEGCTVVDLCCGSGRDTYLAAQLVGEQGKVIGVEPDASRLARAEKYLDQEIAQFGYDAPNVELIHGVPEDLSMIPDESVDIVISNCTFNLSPDKEAYVREVHRILVSLDITEQVVQEAVDGGFDLIVSHHPVMNCTWYPVQTLRTDDRQGRILTKLAENRISAICMHTNLDAADGGVNDVLAEKLGLQGLSPLTEEKIGRIGTLKCEIPLVEFTRFVIESLGCNGLRYTDCGKPVRRVAVGGGACGDYIPQAIAAGCDTFVTSDLRYHDFLDTTALNLIDAGHFPTEDVICAPLVEYLQKAFPAATVIKTTAHSSEVIQYCIKEK